MAVRLSWFARRHPHWVCTFVTPKPETVAAVNEWLSANGLKATVLSTYGDWIALETTVDRASELFDTEFPLLCTMEAGRGPFVLWHIQSRRCSRTTLNSSTLQSRV